MTGDATALTAELQRQQDLVAELRSQVKARDQAWAHVMEARCRISVALGHPPGRVWALEDLAAEVERRLAEQDATIDRLQAEKLDAIQGVMMRDIPLPP